MTRIGDRSEMEAFVRATDLGSFSAAARELGISPSALSKLVSRLETSLGVHLLSRTTRGLRPTAEGELFLNRCRRILAEIEDAESELTSSMQSPRGRLRLHAGIGFGTHLLVPMLPRFLHAYPSIDVELVLQDRALELARHRIDISIWPGEPADTSVVARKLCEFERVVCASPEYLQRRGEPQTPEDLQNHDCITLAGLPASLAPWSFSTGSARLAVRVSGRVEVNNAEGVRLLALEGLGVARLNRFIVSDDLRNGRLRQVMAGVTGLELQPLYALYPHMRHRLPRVAVMLKFLSEELADPDW
jgi:DNA-binding transcriptional LysR family regulator